MSDTWALPAEAQSITNKPVSQEDLDSAQTVIDLYSNVTPFASGSLSDRDIRWLKYAVSWQAVWQGARVGFGEEKDIDQVTQDGMTYMKGNADAHVLSPIARRALFRLSWNKARTLDPLSQEEALYMKTGVLWNADVTQEWTDEFQRWEPMS